ncbi:MAG: DUF2807 domain-containing protein [Cyclobacteriaceae bacterium]
MKKNISINISGIIFHIEEDGYETLKKYLDSINRYFSTFEDSSEILADIESRIAEIFLSKLKEEKQVITAEDVSTLMATMGSVSDFKAVEDIEEKATPLTPGATEAETPFEKAVPPGTNYTYTPPRHLMRDQKRKILGGVCAGLGNYFKIDPLWVRLIFAALLFVYGFIVIVYVVMWVVVPGSYDLEEPDFGKKMFRDPQRKVLGGVSGGIAAYLGIDIILVRILFILLVIAGGLGVFLYIILWVSLPEAKSLTDKMQMQGEPVTLSNIESNIKKNFNIKEGEESTVTKILLFPFRLIGLILTGLGRIIEPLVDIVRVIIGVIIILMGISLVFAIIVTAGILFGIFATNNFSPSWMGEFQDMNLPMEAFTRAFPGWIAIAAVVAALVPSIFIILLGASTIAKRLVFQGTAGWTLFVLFFISIAMLAVGVPKIVFSFHEEGKYKIESNYQITGKTAVLKVNENGSHNYDAVKLTLKGYQGTDFRLVQTFEAQGSSRGQAIENAKMVDYHMEFSDSVFTFDRILNFKDDAIFRGQRVDMILFIPNDFPFIMDEGMSRFITQYVDGEYLDGYIWKMTTRNGLECINCNETKDETLSILQDFDQIEISGRFDLRILHGDNYSVELNGSEKEKEQYKVHRTGQTLIIDFNRKKDFDWDVKDLTLDEMEIIITMPSIEKIEAVGLGTIRFEDFTSDDFEIDARGPVKIRGEINAHNLIVNLTGKSEADLSGNTNNLNARIEFASKLRAYNLQARDAFIEVSGASSAKVTVTGTLEMDEGVASDIDYRGNPEIVKHD